MAETRRRALELAGKAKAPVLLIFMSAGRRWRTSSPYYEELIGDTAATLRRIADWAGMDVGSDEIIQAITVTGHSAIFNRGGRGRGTAVPETARAHVRALAQFYPDVDFAPLFG